MNYSTSPNITKERVFANFRRVQERIEAACSRSGRRSSDVRLIGVTKYVDSQVARHLVEAGCIDLAESRPQALWKKAAEIPNLDVRWHLIGHLQRNKVERTLPFVDTIHSIDSQRLLDTIEAHCSTRTSELRLLLEINVTSDPTKTGMHVADARAILENWHSKPLHSNIRIVGLMGMSSHHGTPNQSREEFANIRILRDALELEFGTQFPELSMGMSDDFEIAIEQGATMVRLGSILFQSEG